MNSYLERALQEMERATDGLNDSDLVQLRPSEGKWSAAEVLEHLTLAFTSTARLSRKVAAQPQALAPATLMERLKQTIVVGLGIFPSGVQAPQFTLPTGNLLADVRDRFRDALSEMDAALGYCATVHGTSRKIATHPILGPFSLHQWCKFHFVHTRHHMTQIRRMRALALRRNPAASGS